MPILSRFFLVTSHSGVVSTQIHIENAEERPGMGAAMLECANAHWTYHYRTGYIVTLRGTLSVTLVTQTFPAPVQQQGSPSQQNGNTPGAQQQQPIVLHRFDNLTFNAKSHDKSILVERIEGRRGEARGRPLSAVKTETGPSPRILNAVAGSSSSSSSSSMTAGAGPSTPAHQQHQHQLPHQQGLGQLDDLVGNANRVVPLEEAYIPCEPVNAFGIPQAAMRCLEVRF